MISLPQPPSPTAGQVAWQQWYETLWRYARGECSTSADVNATIPSASKYHGVTALTAARDLTLPASKSITDGDELIVQDESGMAGTHMISIRVQGTDTVNATTLVTISSNYGRRRIIKRGDGKFYSA